MKQNYSRLECIPFDTSPCMGKRDNIGGDSHGQTDNKKTISNRSLVRIVTEVRHLFRDSAVHCCVE